MGNILAPAYPLVCLFPIKERQFSGNTWCFVIWYIHIYIYVDIYIYIYVFSYIYIHIHTYTNIYNYSHIYVLIWIDKDIYNDIYIFIFTYICREYHMHPCVCILFTGFCLAAGAPLLCSLCHAQLLPDRPWAETNEPNPPPKRTSWRDLPGLEKVASKDGGKGACHGTCWIFNMQNLNPLSLNLLCLLVHGGSRCQVGHLRTHSALMVGMGMWWAILISGSMKTCLSIQIFIGDNCFFSMWVGTRLFWNEFNNGSSLGII